MDPKKKSVINRHWQKVSSAIGISPKDNHIARVDQRWLTVAAVVKQGPLAASYALMVKGLSSLGHNVQ